MALLLVCLALVVGSCAGSGQSADASRAAAHPVLLLFYDWEADVLTPSGKVVAPLLNAQDPTAGAISQGAGTAGQGQPLYDAVKLAAKQPPVANAKEGSRIGSAFYLFDSQHRYIAGPGLTRNDLISAIGKRALPPRGQVLEVPQGTVVLQAVPSSPNDKTTISDPAARFYVLRDRVALSGKDLRNSSQGFNQNGAPDVQFQFSNAGKHAFHDVTRRIAQRGTSLQLPGVNPQSVLQHFAVALDGKLISVASIDPQQLPDGIDGENGAIIEGGFTIQSAQDLARQIEDER